MATTDRTVRPAKDSKYYTASDLRRVIGQLGFVVSYFKGVSMRPLIWEGNHYVVIAPLQGQARIGDILVFEQIRSKATAYILHRLIAIESIGGTDVYVTRGDNCLNCERFTREDIIGRVAEVYRDGRWKPWHALPKSHFTVEDRCYKRYSSLWMKSWPIRQQLYVLRGFLSKIKHKLTCRRDIK